MGRLRIDDLPVVKQGAAEPQGQFFFSAELQSCRGAEVHTVLQKMQRGRGKHMYLYVCVVYACVPMCVCIRDTCIRVYVYLHMPYRVYQVSIDPSMLRCFNVQCC